MDGKVITEEGDLMLAWATHLGGLCMSMASTNKQLCNNMLVSLILIISSLWMFLSVSKKENVLSRISNSRMIVVLKIGRISPIYKRGGKDPLLTNSYRGVRVNSVLSKLLELLVLRTTPRGCQPTSLQSVCIM